MPARDEVLAQTPWAQLPAAFKVYLENTCGGGADNWNKRRIGRWNQGLRENRAFNWLVEIGEVKP